MKVIRMIGKIIKFILATIFFVFLFMFIPIAYKNADPFYRMTDYPGYAPLIIPVILGAIIFDLIIGAIINKLIPKYKFIIKTGITIFLVILILILNSLVLKDYLIPLPSFLYKYETTDFFGLQPYNIETNSMVGDRYDNFSQGDLVFFRLVDKDEELIKGMVYSYVLDDPINRKIITHRYLGMDKDGKCIFKGDANAGNDLLPVSRDKVQGKFIIKLPKFGLILTFINATRYHIVYGIICYIIIKYILSIFDYDEEIEKQSDEEYDQPQEDYVYRVENYNKENYSQEQTNSAKYFDLEELGNIPHDLFK